MAFQVGIDVALPHFLGNLTNGRCFPNAGVVHKHIESTEARHHGGKEGIDGFNARHIAGLVHHALVFAVGEGFELG